jgi:predicted transposase/invertase (TIGR01784 family)
MAIPYFRCKLNVSGVMKKAKKAKKLIRFDWAIKKLLRQKANFVILEGFLSELLGEDIKIKQILESESNKQSETDKYNRVDILVQTSNGELVIVEVQNNKELDYLQRILYGTSKVVSEYIREGDPYSTVKKVISVTIAYFDLGQGKDYVYRGTTAFVGIHKGDILTLSEEQRVFYDKKHIDEIFPEYWIIKVSKFQNRITDKLDEWIYFLKNSEVLENFSAKGIKEAKTQLDELKMSDKDRTSYKRFLKHLHDVASEQETKIAEIEFKIKQAEEKGIEQGMEKKEIETVLSLHENNMSIATIAKILKISEEKVLQIIEQQKDN